MNTQLKDTLKHLAKYGKNCDVSFIANDGLKQLSKLEAEHAALVAVAGKYEKSLRFIINLCEAKPEPCACKFADEGTVCLYCETKNELANLAAVRSNA